MNSLPTLQWPGWKEKPAPLDFVLPGLLAGTVGGLISPGGMGKSILILQLLILVACGMDMLGLGSGWGTGLVAYLPAEDPKEALRHRLFSLQAWMTQEQYEVARERILINPLVGLMPDLADERWFATIRNLAHGRRLLVIDTLRRFHRLDENNPGDMAEIIARLEAIANETGCSIIFLHHSGKAAALNGQGDQQQASRGSSVLTDNIRWQAYLVGASADDARQMDIDPELRGYYVRFGLSKANYSQPIAEHWLKRNEGGVMSPASITKGNDHPEAAHPNKRRAKPGSTFDIAMSANRYRAVKGK